MSRNPLDDEFPGGMRRLQDWWLELPLSYRVNALLYLLGGLALLFLVTQLFSPDGPRDIEVGAGVPPTTSTTAKGPSAAGTGPTSTAATTTTTSGSTTTAGGGAQRAAQSAGGGRSNAAVPPAAEVPTAPTTPPCRNSTEPCGEGFRWDPPPDNKPVSVIDIVPSGTAGNQVTFSVTVTDPDHLLDSACAEMTFGDGQRSAPCSPPPCPARYGPWDTPAPEGSSTRVFTFTHAYAVPGSYTAIARVEDRRDCHDPYGGTDVKSIQFAIQPPTTTTSTTTSSGT